MLVSCKPRFQNAPGFLFSTDKNETYEVTPDGVVIYYSTQLGAVPVRHTHSSMREAIDWVFKQESGISERSGTTAELNTLQSQFVELYRSYDRSALFAINKAQQYVQDNDFERARLQLNSSVVYCAKAEALKEVIAVLDVRKQVAAVKSVPLKET